MNANVSKSMNEQISQQELQYLITVSTGFIDAYIIECHGKTPMILPQNIEISPTSGMYCNCKYSEKIVLPTT